MSVTKLKAKPNRSSEIIVPDKLYFRIGEVLSSAIFRHTFCVSGKLSFRSLSR